MAGTERPPAGGNESGTAEVIFAFVSPNGEAKAFLFAFKNQP
jgi:hypothetical protein